MKNLLILTIAVTVFFGCSKNSDTNTSEVYIRLSNISKYNFKNIVVYTEIRNVSLKGYICFRIHADKLFEIKY